MPLFTRCISSYYEVAQKPHLHYLGPPYLQISTRKIDCLSCQAGLTLHLNKIQSLYYPGLSLQILHCRTRLNPLYSPVALPQYTPPLHPSLVLLKLPRHFYCSLSLQEHGNRIPEALCSGAFGMVKRAVSKKPDPGPRTSLRLTNLTGPRTSLRLANWSADQFAFYQLVRVCT